jgi:hypothetical protein
MENCVLDGMPVTEMFDHNPLEQRWCHSPVPHPVRVNDDDWSPATNAKTWRFAAFDPTRAEQQTLSLKQVGQQLIKVSSAPVGRAEAPGAHEHVTGVGLHAGSDRRPIHSRYLKES